MSEEKKERKTKLEKICELESSLKLLKEENRRYKKQVAHLKDQNNEDESQVSEFSASRGGGGGKNDEKLKDAMRTLKRVTVKQELSLKTLRSKAKQRRSELEQKDSVIEEMRAEIKSLKKTHDRMRGKETNDAGVLRQRVADLELKLAKEDTKNEAQNKRLLETTENVSTLRGQLDGLRGHVSRGVDSKSVRSTGSSQSRSSAEDIGRLKRELASKMEKIANLEYDLESAREEIVEMKQSKFAMDFGDGFDTAFPATPAPGVDDFFNEDEDDEDFW
jgi:DNA repair exonuclease SbcCD ATPase subunit